MQIPQQIVGQSGMMAKLYLGITILSLALAAYLLYSHELYAGRFTRADAVNAFYFLLSTGLVTGLIGYLTAQLKARDEQQIEQARKSLYETQALSILLELGRGPLISIRAPMTRIPLMSINQTYPFLERKDVEFVRNHIKALEELKAGVEPLRPFLDTDGIAALTNYKDFIVGALNHASNDLENRISGETFLKHLVGFSRNVSLAFIYLVRNVNIKDEKSKSIIESFAIANIEMVDRIEKKTDHHFRVNTDRMLEALYTELTNNA